MTFYKPLFLLLPFVMLSCQMDSDTSSVEVSSSSEKQDSAKFQEYVDQQLEMIERAEKERAEKEREKQQLAEQFKEDKTKGEASVPPEVLEALRSYSDLDSLHPFTENETPWIRGNFYGQGGEEFGMLLRGEKGVYLAIIPHNKDTIYSFVSLDYDQGKPHDFGWAGIFKKASAGDTLWSNYEDDFRSFSDVPEDEKVVLSHDAFYVHASESCGGGFIFWKDGMWNWLQQE